VAAERRGADGCFAPDLTEADNADGEPADLAVQRSARDAAVAP